MLQGEGLNQRLIETMLAHSADRCPFHGVDAVHNSNWKTLRQCCVIEKYQLALVFIIIQTRHLFLNKTIQALLELDKPVDLLLPETHPP